MRLQHYWLTNKLASESGLASHPMHTRGAYIFNILIRQKVRRSVNSFSSVDNYSALLCEIGILKTAVFGK